MLSLEVLLLQIALAGLRDVKLDLQISWEAQNFVDLEVWTLLQAQHFVNLEVQICGRRSTLWTLRCRFRGGYITL